MLAVVITFCGSSVQASDYTTSCPLTLEVPEMTPTLTYERADTYRPELKLEVKDHAPWAKENWTWMRTNPGVKPYKVMDDLTFVGVPVFLAGIIAKSEKSAFRQNTKDNKHTLLTDFKTGIDDYSQFFGPVMTTGLKIAGVEGRSDWGRYLASTAMSYAIMAGFVNGIKYTAKEMRPDGSTANSWPSGHTATAFVGATILHKEYGMTRSPWYSVAGYGVATATGVMRVLNNRHWISDVLSGAGIGIMSTELAYALSDVFFKGKGLLRGDISGEKSIIDHPSFFSISMGIGFGSSNVDFDMGDLSFTELDDEDKAFNLKFKATTAVAAEGAYFINKYIGFGGRLRVNSAPIKGWDGIEAYAWNDMIDTYANLLSQPDMQVIALGDEDGTRKPYLDDVTMTIKSDHLTEFAVDLGVYFNLPLSRRFALGSKLLIGRSIMQEIDLNATAKGGKWTYDLDDDYLATNIQYHGEYEREWDYFTVSGNNTMKYGTGISLTYAYKENFAWKLFFDYDFTRKTYTMEYNPAGYLASAFPDMKEVFEDDIFKASKSVKKNRHTFILGGSFTVSF
ncbi:PAP2 superfamily protein [Prevotellaceae bacterium MN60]|nr:PAP2 superfamily protein [Prevotellaceae bacterium MN60]